MFPPSKATYEGLDPVPVEKGLNGTCAPVLASSFDTVPSLWFATQMYLPSNVIPQGFDPTANDTAVHGVVQDARILLTVLLPELATQIFVPSKAKAPGDVPVGIVFSKLPLGMANFWTVPLKRQFAQICDPSYPKKSATQPERGIDSVVAPVATFTVLRSPLA